MTIRENLERQCVKLLFFIGIGINEIYPSAILLCLKYEMPFMVFN